jgi:hypothetical protein
MKKLLWLIMISLLFSVFTVSCSQDVEVERTRLPHVDKPAE